jgi:hypothetical protein
MSVPKEASTKLGLGGHLAEDCHSCSQRAFIFLFALVEIVAGRLWLSGGTHCRAQVLTGRNFPEGFQLLRL